MSWEVRYHPDVAARDLVGIPADQRARIRRAIEQRLMVDPAAYGDRLRKDLAGAWKLRVGDYRIVFDLDPAKKLVVVQLVAHRRDVYRLAAARLGAR